MRARYLAQVRERVTRHRRYPSAAQRLGIEGTVYVRVCIGPDGTLLSAAPVREGPDPELTIAALTAVRAASPFRPLPPELGRSLTVDIPIAFLLEDE
jgi:protein TonB